jgi:putative ABC transport system permease protein
VSFGYFKAMGLPLVNGRSFGEHDRMDSPPVVTVNETLAARFFPDQDAVGQRIKFAFTGDLRFEIVGIVGDEKVVPLDAETTPVVYFPHLQTPDLAMSLVARTDVDPIRLADVVQREVRVLDADLFVYHVESMEHYINRLPSTTTRRYPALLISIFAGIALTLAMIGIYGIISYSVSQRTHELAIRMALGATRGDIFKLVVGQGLGLTLIGVAAGVAAALVLTRFLSSMLFNVSAIDLLTFVEVSGLLAVVATIATYLPARRATKVDPMVALRCE